LEILQGVEFIKAIGDFHVKGHVKTCFICYSLSYIQGAAVIDSKILETLWYRLNQSSKSIRGATLAHQLEILDDHMNHSNWKKMLQIGEKRIKMKDDDSDLLVLEQLILKLPHLAGNGSGPCSSTNLLQRLWPN
jgi:hypothetical protein